MNDNNDQTEKISQTDVQTELSRHGHPKSRKLDNGKQQTVRDMRAELANHYKYAHQK